MASSLENEPAAEPTDFFQIGQDDSAAPRIYMRYDLFRAIEEFAMRDTAREMAGLLLGHTGNDYLMIEEAVECGVAEDEGGRFTARVFQHAKRIARHRYPQLRILGWFHTHPGSGLDLSAEEREVHRANFPDPGHVLYVEDPVRKDRNFHYLANGQLTPARGFRIWGKEAFKEAVHEAPAPARPDEHLRERYLERSLEKIQRMLRRPGWQLKDTIIVGLLLLNLGVMLMRPSGSSPVAAPESSGDPQVLERLDAISSRLEQLEQHLAALQVIDQELLGTATPTPSASPTRKPSPSPTGRTGARVRLHKVKQGDTMSTIAEKYYGTSDPAVTAALGRYNKLKPPNYDMWPGDTVKIPERKDLKVR